MQFYEERGSHWSQQVSAMVTTWWSRVTRSSCAKGVACKTILYMCWPLAQRAKCSETFKGGSEFAMLWKHIWVILQYLNFPNIFSIILLENSCDVLAHWLKSWTDQKIHTSGYVCLSICLWNISYWFLLYHAFGLALLTTIFPTKPKAPNITLISKRSSGYQSVCSIVPWFTWHMKRIITKQAACESGTWHVSINSWNPKLSAYS